MNYIERGTGASALANVTRQGSLGGRVFYDMVLPGMVAVGCHDLTASEAPWMRGRALRGPRIENYIRLRTRNTGRTV